MYHQSLPPKNRLPTLLIVLVCIKGLLPVSVFAWGYEGHAKVGRLALSSVDDKAGSRVAAILEMGPVNTIDEACNWPDAVRETPEWDWSAPQHYVNIPRASHCYEQQRDCSNGLCVTEAIKKYANDLTKPGLSPQKQWEALAWLCHLVGDLHQPLHAGYRDDRGGNNVDITFNEEAGNLHQFWDQMLIQHRIQDDPEQFLVVPMDGSGLTGNTWNPVETNEWTTASHKIVTQSAYPANSVIQPAFADQSWQIIQAQLQLAGDRLARILNATAGDGEVELDGETSSSDSEVRE